MAKTTQHESFLKKIKQKTLKVDDFIPQQHFKSSAECVIILPFALIRKLFKEDFVSGHRTVWHSGKSDCFHGEWDEQTDITSYTKCNLRTNKQRKSFPPKCQTIPFSLFIKWQIANNKTAKCAVIKYIPKNEVYIEHWLFNTIKNGFCFMMLKTEKKKRKNQSSFFDCFTEEPHLDLRGRREGMLKIKMKDQASLHRSSFDPSGANF